VNLRPHIKSGYKFLCSLVLACSCLVTSNSSAAATDITLYRTYSGNIDYIAVGASFRDEPNGVDSCSFVDPMSTQVVVNIPGNAAVLEAFLYISGSGNDDLADGPIISMDTQTGLSLNNVPISTGTGGENENYEINNVAGDVDFFAARRDVTNLVTGPGVYTFAGLNVHTVADGRVNNQTCLGTWSLVVVYQDPAVSNIRVINLFDGFRDFQNIQTGFALEPRNFVLRAGAKGKVTHITYEGDDTLGAGSGGACGACTERFTIRVPSSGIENDLINPLNPLTNQFNGTVTGPDVFDSDTSYGLDLDTYPIDSILGGAVGEYSAQTRYYAAQDLVILQAEVFVVENKPLADIEINLSNTGSFVENSTGQYRISVTNNGDGTGNISTGNATDFIQVFADLPNGIDFSSFSAGAWSCDGTAAATNNRIRCSYDVTSLTAGQPGLDAFESLEDILVNVTIGDIATTGATVNMSGWAFSCDDAALNSDAVISNGTMSNCDSFDEKHSSDLAQFDNRGFFEEIETSYFGSTTKSAANNNVDFLQVSVLSNTQSDLSTTTKTATDINGGSLQIGDTLEYQIVISETAGNATTGGVVLTDLVDTDTTYVFGSLSVVGSPYTVVSSGSTLELAGLVIPASGSVTVTFRVTVNNSAPGETIENNVILTNANGPDTSAAIGPRFVSIDNNVGNKPLYLDINSAPDGALTRTIPATDASSGALSQNTSASYVLVDIKNSLTVLSGDIPLSLWIQNEAGTGEKTISITLTDELGITLGSASKAFSFSGPGEFELVPFIMNTAGFTLNNSNNKFISLSIQNTSLNAADTFSVHNKKTSVSSSLVLDSQTVINIESLKVRENTCINNGAELTANAMQGANICIEAVVSDPFGEYDIQPVGLPSLTITDPDALSSYSGTFLETLGVTDDETTYEWDFLIPTSGPSLGLWNINLSVDEGGEGTISDSAQTNFQTANEADLSNSVKTVVNIDNAVSRPGDTLRYTITINETNGGAASGVSLIDYIPPATNNLSIISFPAGATNNSSTTVIDITNITVPASSSVSIIFEVDISLGTPIGTRIDNTAEINDPASGDIDVAAPSIFVYGAPSNGSKLLYLDDLGGTNVLTRDQTESDDNADKSSTNLAALGDSVTLVQTPATAKPLALNAGPINVSTWLHRNNEKNDPELRVVEFQLGYQSGAGGGGSTGIIDTVSQSTVLGSGEGSAGLITTVFTLANDILLNTNTEIFLRITNNTTGNLNHELTITSFLNSIPSTVELDAKSVINVDSITIYDSAGFITTTPSPGELINIIAVVSDPFGDADIQPTGEPTLVITDPDSIVINPNTSANYASEAALAAQVDDLDDGTRTYDWTFTVPTAPGPPTQGTWSVEVTADEGHEGTISNTAAVVFNTDSISDLSQSTKSVMDKFGGETEPGDVIVYTVTLTNSSTFDANNVSVTDFLAPNLGSLGAITVPPNPTLPNPIDNSTLGTGPLSINNISVPAGSSVNITFEVTVDASAQPGDLLNNTAGINNPAGIGANPAAETLTVSPSLIPSTGNKILYLSNSVGVIDHLSRAIPLANGDLTLSEQGGQATLNILPTLKKNLTLEAGPIPISLWLSSTENGGKNPPPRQFNVNLSYSGSSSGSIGSQTLTTSVDANPAQKDFYIDLASQIILLAGTSIDLVLSNDTSNNGRDAVITSNPTAQLSTVKLNASTVINVDSVDVYDTAYPDGSIVTSRLPSETAYIRAVVSDPFGAFDINPDCPLNTVDPDCPAITVTGPTDASLTTTMQLVDDPTIDNGTRIFEFAYLVPPQGTDPGNTSEELGQWDISITANEGKEGTVEHTAFGSFSTEGIPDLSTSEKSVVDKFGGEADAGDVLVYSINIYETGGTTATGVSVTDNLPANLSYVPGTLALCQDSNDPLDDCSEPVTFSGDFAGSNLVLTNLTVPADGWLQVQFEATIDGGATAGELIDNSVTIANPNGPGAVVGSPTLTVSPSQISNTGTKDIYLKCSIPCVTLDSLSREVPTSDVTIDLTGGLSTSFDLTPETARELTLASGTIPVYLVVNGFNRNNRARSILVSLSYSGASTGLIGNDSQSIVLSNDTADIVIVPFAINLTSNITLDANTKLTLTVANNSQANRGLTIHTLDSSFTSKVQLNSNTVVNVDSVDTYNDAFPAGSIVTSRTPSDIAYIRAVVSDPFGAFDINPDCPLNTVDPDCPAITVTGPTDAVLTTTMRLVDDPAIDDGTRTYEYQYTVPPEGTGTGELSEELGQWDISVTANEGTEGTISHTAVGNFSTAGDPNVSTSEKLVVDKFGGDADPGDVLVYTINIFETGGATEIGITVTDTLPANTTYVPGSLVLCQDVSAPFDNCVDPVVSTGDVVGGVLSLTDVTVPADSLVRIEFEVTINGGAQPGDFVDNSATIYNPSGPGAGVQAPSVIVSVSQLGNAGAKNLYFENINQTGPIVPNLTRTLPTNDSQATLDGQGSSINLTLREPTERELTLGSGTIFGDILIAGNTDSGPRLINVTLSYSGSSSGIIGTDSISITLQNDPATIVAAPFSIDLSSELTLPAGTQFDLNITNDSSVANRKIDLHSAIPADGDYSYLGLISNTVINVDSIAVYDAAFPIGSIVTTRTPSQTAYIRALVSDPFGSFDINPDCPLNTVGTDCPAITVTGPADGGLTTTMQLVDDPGINNGTRTYEYQYTIPPEGTGTGDTFEELGQWDISITAHEGTEGTIEHSAVAVFFTNDTPDVSTSTKTVVDQNGGDVEPGDTLEYTISINETNNAATTVSLFDVIDSNTNNLIITNNGGGTTNVAAPANTVDISAIPITASGSVDVVFTVDVAAGLAPGTLLNNSASVINPTGPSGSATADTLIVSESQLAVAGTKALYLDDLSASSILTRTQPIAATEVTINNSSNITVDLAPALSTDLTLAAGDLTVFLWLHRAGGDVNRSVNVQLSYFGASSGVIDDDSQFVSLGNSLATGTRVPFVINIPGDITLLKGTQLRLTISNQTATVGENLIVSGFNNGETEPFSQINLNSLTVINIDEISLYDAAHGGASTGGLGNQITSAQQGDTIYLRAIVSDPFGSFDINVNCGSPASACPPIDIKLPGGTVIASDFMDEVYDDALNENDGIKVFEYAYTLPAMAASGFWEAEVTVVEGEELEISHNANQTFFVGTPQITLLHFTNGSITDADPNSDIIYTVRVTHTSGPTATGLELKGFISEFVKLNADKYGSLTPFQLDNGFSLTLQEFSVDADGIAIVYDHTLAAPYDGDVTHYRVVITEPINAGESFDMTYEVQVQ
jgi:uncharacterized repeat protein (TIGR01451 family)